jgi:uncharacterized protein YkwD
MRRVVVGFVSFMLTASSIGGTYATAVYANPVNEKQVTTGTEEKGIKDKSKDNAALGGLLLVGLVTLMGKGGSDHKSSGSGGGKNYIQPNTKGGSGTTTPNSTGTTTPNNSGTATQNSSGSTSKSSMTAEEVQLLNLINNERTKQGLATLKANNAVANVARAHSQDMANNNYFDHYNLKGESPFTRLRSAGISYLAAGENIAINVSVPSAHQAFMNSSGHRANVLGRDYTEVGVGIIHDGSRIYVTEEFIGK